MIHIITVHYGTGKWVDIQLKHIERWTDSEYRIYASLDNMPADFRNRFYYTTSIPQKGKDKGHQDKLDALANYVRKQADPNDIMIFMDGDAFPIANYMNFVRRGLKEYPLVAIRRNECGLEYQPHPSFCATTIKFWKDIGCTWDIGWWPITLDVPRKMPVSLPNVKWIKGKCNIRDVGGKLYNILKNYRIAWLPYTRTNRINFHPLYFGVYDNIIYHHGCGFRNAWGRVDVIIRAMKYKDKFWKDLEKYKRLLNKLSDNIYRQLLVMDDVGRMFRR